MNPDVRQLEQDYADHKIIASDIVKDLDISVSTWYTHIKYHLTPQICQALSTNADVLALQIIDKQCELIEMLDVLGAEITKVQTEGDHNILEDDKRMKALTGLLSEKRKIIEVMAKMQGEYKDSTTIRANNINIEYNNLMGMVMQDACPMCKQKFATKIPNVIKVINENDP